MSKQQRQDCVCMCMCVCEFSKQMSEKTSFFADVEKQSYLDEHLSVKSVVTSGQERALSSESFSADSGERTKTTSQRSSSPNTTHQLPPTVAAVCHHLGVGLVYSQQHVGGQCQLSDNKLPSSDFNETILFQFFLSYTL